MAWLPGCLVTERTWEKAQGRRKPDGDQKNLLYTWALLFCYLTTGVEKPHGYVKLSGSLLHDLRQLIRHENRRVSRRRSLTWSFPSTSTLRQERPALPAAAALAISLCSVFSGFMYWSSFIYHSPFVLFAETGHQILAFLDLPTVGTWVQRQNFNLIFPILCLYVWVFVLVLPLVSWWNELSSRIWALGEIPGGQLPWPLPLGRSISERSQRAPDYPWGHLEGWKRNRVSGAPGAGQLRSLEAPVSHIETLSNVPLVKNALLLRVKRWNYWSVPPGWDSCSP